MCETLYQRLKFAADETEQKEIVAFEKSHNVFQFEPTAHCAPSWLQTIFTVFASNKIMEESNQDYTIIAKHDKRINTWKCTSTVNQIVYTVKNYH